MQNEKSVGSSFGLLPQTCSTNVIATTDWGSAKEQLKSSLQELIQVLQLNVNAFVSCCLHNLNNLSFFPTLDWYFQFCTLFSQYSKKPTNESYSDMDASEKNI